MQSFWRNCCAAIGRRVRTGKSISKVVIASAKVNWSVSKVVDKVEDALTVFDNYDDKLLERETHITSEIRKLLPISGTTRKLHSFETDILPLTPTYEVRLSVEEDAKLGLSTFQQPEPRFRTLYLTAPGTGILFTYDEEIRQSKERILIC